MATLGGGPLIENLLQVDQPSCAPDLAIGVAGKSLADQIGTEEGLMDLADRRDLHAAHDRQHGGVAM